jgi:hypothetical protein
MKRKNFNVFIWTEAYNCGELLGPMLDSYITHNEMPINVFGTKQDLEYIKNKSPLIITHISDSKNSIINYKFEKKILKKYKKGHKGTALLWSKIIRDCKERYFLHLDSDNIFLGDVTTELINAMKQSFAIAGSRRSYFYRNYRKQGRDGKALDKLPDAVNTDCFIFDTNFVRVFPKVFLKRKIVGKRSIKHPVVDFFDPITFEIINNGGNVFYADSPLEGSTSKINTSSDFMQNRISFTAVGSGVNFYKNPDIKVPIGYKNFALQSYALYSKWILDVELSGVNPHNDLDLIDKLESLDKRIWKLKDNVRQITN